MKSYRLYADVDIYPYEIEVYDPRSDEPKPEWLTDILKFDGVNDDGTIKFCEVVDDKGGITYPIPKTNGHLYIPIGSMIARNVNSGQVFPFKSALINDMYKEKIGLFRKIIRFMKSIIH